MKAIRCAPAVLVVLGLLLNAETAQAAAAAEASKTVAVHVIAEDDAWRAPGLQVVCGDSEYRPGQWFLGAQTKIGTVRVEPGRSFVVEGRMGWRTEFAVDADGQAAVARVDQGPRLAAKPRVEPFGKLWVVALPPRHEVALDVPWALYAWRLVDTPEDLRGYHRTGPWTVTLPEGRWTLAGDTGWQVDFAVGDKGLTVLAVRSGRYGFTDSDMRIDGYRMAFPAPAVTRVSFEVPEALGPWAIAGFVRAAGDGMVWLPAGPCKVAGTGFGKLDIEVDRDAVRIAQYEPGKTAADVSVEGTLVRFVPRAAAGAEAGRTSPLAAYVFIKDKRRVFGQGESADLSVVVKSPPGTATVMDLRLASVDGTLPLDRKTLAADPVGTRTFNYRMDTGRLRPGDYTLEVTLGGQLTGTAPLKVMPPVRDTRFKVLVYGGYTDLPRLDRFAAGGINMIIHNHLGPHALRPRLGPAQARAYEQALATPSVPPVEAGLSPTTYRQYLEALMERGIDLFAQYGAGHQFFHYGTCFLDPDIRDAVARGASAMVRSGREWPNLAALNLGDEMGTHRGFAHPEGCTYCRALFERAWGVPVPRGPGDDVETWLKWMDYKQSMLPVLMSQVAGQVKPYDDILISSQHGGANYWPQDGGYPPRGMTAFDVSAGHHYFAWAYGSVQTLWCALHDELLRTMPRRPAYWPFILPNTGPAATRHEINLCLTRGCQGAGYFTDPEPAFKDQWPVLASEVHPMLHRLGDLFIALDREPSREVALYYSYRQHALGCYVDPKVSWEQPVRYYLDRVAMALYACLRAHIPVGFVGEEQVRAGELARRRALLVVGLTQIEPDLRARFEEFIRRGGVVFADAETTVDLPGARKLDTSFGEFHDRSYRLGRFAGTPPPINDTVVTIPLAQRLQAALGELVRPDQPATADSPHLIITEQRGGSARYLFLLNDRFAGMNDKEAVFEPLTANLSIPKFSGVLYDVAAGKAVEPAMSGEDATMRLALAPGELKLLARLPEPLAGVQTAVRADATAISTWVWLMAKSGTVAPVTVPVHVTVTDPTGKVRVDAYRATEDGRVFLRLPLAANEAPGVWKVAAQELLSGLRGSGAALPPAVPAHPPALITELGDVLVDHAADVSRFVRSKHELVIVVGRLRHLATARALAAALQAQRGCRARVEFDCEMDRNAFPPILGRGFARSDFGVRHASPDLEINEDLILLGSPTGNRLLQRLYFESEWPLRLVTPDVPGPGNGVLDLVPAAFSGRGHDALLVCATDDAGLYKAAEKLLDIIGERDTGDEQR